MFDASIAYPYTGGIRKQPTDADAATSAQLLLLPSFLTLICSCHSLALKSVSAAHRSIVGNFLISL